MAVDVRGRVVVALRRGELALTLPPKSAKRPGLISSNTAPLRRHGDAAIDVFFVEYSLGGFVALTFEAFLAAAHAVSTKTAASLMARQWRLLGVSAFLRNALSSDIAGNKRYAWLESRVKSLKCCTHARELLKNCRRAST